MTRHFRAAAAWTRERSRAALLVLPLAALLAVAVGGSALASVSRAHRLAAREAKHQFKPTRATVSRSGAITLNYQFGELQVEPGVHGGYVICPRGFIAIGGGFEAEDVHVQVMAANPLNPTNPNASSPNAWGTIYNDTSTETAKSTDKVYGFVVCIKASNAKVVNISV
jgi:hypothetical protein